MESAGLCKSRGVAHRDGDGWVECACGNRHWGVNGAAGLMLVRDRTILLQHRAPWVHNGDTWGIPGGARDSHETPTEAALREAHEEIGWSYDTVISKAHKDLVAHEQNDESLQVEWVAFEDVVTKNLHPSFAKTWPVLLARLEIIFI